MGRTREHKADGLASHPTAKACGISGVTKAHMVVPGQQRPLLQPRKRALGGLALHVVQHHQFHPPREPQPVVLADWLWRRRILCLLGTVANADHEVDHCLTSCWNVCGVGGSAAGGA